MIWSIFSPFWQVFDELDIEDENIADYAKKIGLMSPSQVLITCLKR